ncbi:MAG: HU family DNA-binding protein [Deltaproteobacteria bacterium]
MTKAELVEEIHGKHGNGLSRRAVSELIDEVFAQIGKSVKRHGRFVYPDFGTFTLKKRKARVGRNPQTGAELKIGASRTVGFKPAPELKKSL